MSKRADKEETHFRQSCTGASLADLPALPDGRTVWCPCPPGSVVVSILRHVLEELNQPDGNGDDAEPESVPEKEEKPNE